jgi:toxin ParE1/3/4
MTKRILITPKASVDIDEHFEYLAQANLEAALRFFDAARQTFAQLARTPGMGRFYGSTDEKLYGLRQWAVKGFKNQLVFYFEQDDCIEIIRVLNAVRNIEAILKQNSQ